MPAGAIAYALDCKNLFALNVEFSTGVGTTRDEPASVVTPDYTWRSTERWINFPWSKPPLVDRTGVLDV